MKIDRLFNVLVLGGVAIAASAACNAAREDAPAPGEPDSTASAATDRSESPAPRKTDEAASDAGTDGATTDGGTTDGSTAAPACAKECIDLGLPCCWMGDCTVDPSCKAQLCD